MDFETRQNALDVMDVALESLKKNLTEIDSALKRLRTSTVLGHAYSPQNKTAPHRKNRTAGASSQMPRHLIAKFPYNFEPFVFLVPQSARIQRLALGRNPSVALLVIGMHGMEGNPCSLPAYTHECGTHSTYKQQC